MHIRQFVILLTIAFVLVNVYVTMTFAEVYEIRKEILKYHQIHNVIKFIILL